MVCVVQLCQMGNRAQGRKFPGRVYRALDTESHQHVAVKAEPCRLMLYLLEEEDEVYEVLKGERGFPESRLFAQQDGVNFLVMDLLGPSLDALFFTCGAQFSLRTVVLIGLQAVRHITHVLALLNPLIGPTAPTDRSHRNSPQSRLRARGH